MTKIVQQYSNSYLMLIIQNKRKEDLLTYHNSEVREVFVLCLDEHEMMVY